MALPAARLKLTQPQTIAARPSYQAPVSEGLRQIWDFARCEAEATLAAHGGDVKAAAWHPTQARPGVLDATLC